MKKLKRLLAVLFCAMMSLSVVACGGGGGGAGGGNGNGDDPDANSTKTVIRIQGYEAGVNLDWLRGLARDFEALYAEHSFETNKTGVEFKIEGVGSTEPTSMANSNIHMYIHSGGTYPGRKLAEEGKVVSIDDIVSVKDEVRYDEHGEPYNVSIREKVLPNYYNTLLTSVVPSSNQDISDWYIQKYGLSDSFAFNTCYAMPSYGLQDCGLSYDAYNFNFYGFYLADPTWAAQNPAKVVAFQSKYNNNEPMYFVKGSGSGQLLSGVKKACGNDGKFDTFDDGLPTSMVEFFVLCDYMKSKDVSPITHYGGTGNGHLVRLMTGFELSLSGSNTFQTKFDYDSDGELVEIIPEGNGAFSTQNAFHGIDYIKKANTQEQVITLENGYLATRTSAKYYAIAMQQIAYEEGWYSAMSLDPELSHLDAEDRFILNGMNGRETCGMLLEGNYWYNEAKKNGSITRFALEAANEKDGVVEPDIKWMSLPTRVYDTVEPGQGSDYAAIAKGNAAICINSRYKDNQAVISVLKTFIKYIHSDAALSYYTGSQGVYRAGMQYDVSTADRNNLSSFQKSYLEMYENKEMVIDTSYVGGLESDYDSVSLDGGQKQVFSKYQDGARTDSTNAKALFNKSSWSSTYWNSDTIRPLWQAVQNQG